MEATDLLKTLLEGNEVKVSDAYFESIRFGSEAQNVFSLYQIEQSSVNLYNVYDMNTYFDIPFSEVFLF